MKIRNLTGMLFLMVIVACSPGTLQSFYEKQQKENGMDGFNIIHIEENDKYGLVLATSWTEEYIQNKDKPGIMVYEKDNGKWVSRPGTTCAGLGATLGIGGGRYLYCGSITEKRPYVKIMVGETQAQVFDVSDKKRVWYAVEHSMGIQKWGSYETGEPVKMN
jgi:hypothetical protein